MPAVAHAIAPPPRASYQESVLDDVAFIIANALAAAGWLLLIALPRWPLTLRLATSRLLPLAIAAVYLAALAVSFFDGHGEGHFFSLDGVSSLLRDRTIALVAWIHLLAFDLFVGCHLFLDARARGVRHFVLAPCLALTLLFGPIGFLAYRFATRRLSRGGALQ